MDLKNKKNTILTKRKIIDNPFTFPSDRLFIAYYKWIQAKKKLNTTSKIKSSKCSRKSLIDNNIFHEYSGPTAITDIDPDYYTDLNGRSIIEKFSSKKYIDQTRKVLRGKIIAGYYRDACIKIDQEFANEHEEIINIEKSRKKYAKAFDDYLSNDYEESMKILNEAQTESKNTNEKITKRDELSKLFGKTRLEVYQIEEIWCIVKACHDFMNKISPKDTRKTIANISKNNSRSLQNISTEQESLEKLIENFERDIKIMIPCEIKLKNSNELNKIFSDIELRNLDALIHLESLAGPKDDLSAKMLQAEELVGKEIINIEENLQELKNEIIMCEERSKNLEKYADHLLHDIFKNLVCSESVLHLHVFIEDAYETCIGQNDASLDGYTMMKTIEKTYEKLNMTLDNLPQDIVRVCEKEGFTQEMKSIAEAEDAARKFELMHRLLAALERIMSPTKLDKNIKKNYKFTIKKQNKNKLNIIDNKNKKNQALAYFTDQCDYDDTEITINNSIIDQNIQINNYDNHSNIIYDNECDCRNDVK